MIDVKERNLRQANHDNATEAWSEIGRYSRTHGLGDMVRSVARRQGIRKATPAEVRTLKHARHKERLREVHAKAMANARVFDVRSLDRSRYFPHQSDRERTGGAV